MGNGHGDGEPDWEARYADRSVGESAPAAVLADNGHLLPAAGVALDVACGLGANAILLARHGLETHAWDRSPTAIGRLSEWAAHHPLPLHPAVRDVVARPPEPGRFDVITVTRYLERDLAPALAAALRPGGLLFYQTFNRARVGEQGPRGDRFRLADGELLALFASLEVVFYRDEDRLGDLARGMRDEAQLIARRPVTA